MLTPYLDKLLARSSLTQIEAETALETMLDENANGYQMAAFLALLKQRGETADEVAGMIRSLEKKDLSIDFWTPFLDIVGTGGDRSNTINISTGSAILAAACGVPIAKHGNRSVSSKSGSADVL